MYATCNFSKYGNSLILQDGTVLNAEVPVKINYNALIHLPDFQTLVRIGGIILYDSLPVPKSVPKPVHTIDDLDIPFDELPSTPSVDTNDIKSKKSATGGISNK